jgi:purine-binding chemotaxis protein CheW
MTKLESATDLITESDGDRYLLFFLAERAYGTPLMGVREVVAAQPVKPVPNTIAAFRGLLNLRGQVVGVVDLRVLFGYPATPTPHQAFLVFENENGVVAAVVRVEAVTTITPNLIDHTPQIEAQIPHAFLRGATTYGSQILTLVDLHKTFLQFNLNEIRSTKL